MRSSWAAEDLGQVLAPLDHLNPAAARVILQMKYSKPQLAHVSRLIQRSRKGSLSAQEQVELDAHLQMGNLLTLMHSKARLALKRQSSPPRRKSA